MKQAFVVIGRYGEYSDRREWPVRVVWSEERAKGLIGECDLALARIRTLAKHFHLQDIFLQYDFDPSVKDDSFQSWFERETPEFCRLVREVRHPAVCPDLHPLSLAGAIGSPGYLTTYYYEPVKVED